MTKRKSQSDSKTTKSDIEDSMLEMRRPAAMRWVQLAICVVMMILTLVMISRSAEQSLTVTIIAAAFFILLVLLTRQIWRANAGAVRFDGELITDDTGTLLCRLDQVERVERGMAMLKPSGGFLLVLNTPVSASWTPGLWWRFGHRVGVGGTTPTKIARIMADAITQAIMARKVD